MGWIFVVQPTLQSGLVLGILVMTKMKKESRHFRLLSGGQNNQLLLQIFKAHNLYLILAAPSRKPDFQVARVIKLIDTFSFINTAEKVLNFSERSRRLEVVRN